MLRIPCVLMRGGTSKGPFFLRDDLPADPAARDALLVEIMGSGHPLQVDGIGGGNSLTSKVAIVGRSSRAGADVDYLFAQVKVEEKSVDTAPNCGNMLSAVAAFAVQSGLITADPFETRVRIHNVNTGKIIEARIHTPAQSLRYQGDSRIDGVPGTGQAVHLAFLEAIGAKTGRLLPSGVAKERIEGIEVSLIDGAMPLMVARAADFGLSGQESAAALDGDSAFLVRLERMRQEAGRRMGLGDVSASVVPKPVLIAPAQRGGDLSVRYFTPWRCHTALATTGAVSLAIGATQSGSLLAEALPGLDLPCDLLFEHPSGQMAIRIERNHENGVPVVFVTRTCRPLFEGMVHVRAPHPAPSAAIGPPSRGAA